MHFFKSLLLVCTTVVVVLAQLEHDALVSSTHFIGIDTTILGQSGVDIFRDRRNHASAVASILLATARRAGFRPHQKGVITDWDVFGQFVHQSTRFPAVRPQIEYGSELDLNGDREQFKEAIERAYHPKVNQPKAVANALEKLIPTQLLPGAKIQFWVLMHITLLNEPRRDVTFELAYIALRLKTDRKTGAVKIVPQTASFSANAYKIDSDLLIQQAKNYARQIPTFGVRTFLRELSTADREELDVQRLKSCLEGNVKDNKDHEKDLVYSRSGQHSSPSHAFFSSSSQLKVQN
ncbi:hypothetical protein BGX34_004543 [Mortierella sp. NVP85]|nr:hypothetical protein BGX34_004543 [Mortierella sp. NVP85]